MDSLRNWIVRTSYKIAPFNLQGDLQKPSHPTKNDFISCLVCTNNRPQDMDSLLFALARQTLDCSQFEVVVLNDGAGEATKKIIEQYQSRINIVYRQNQQPVKIIGKLRNETIALSQGEYLIFLDDDTRILQDDFLKRAQELFKQSQADVIIPKGQATFGIVKLKYDYFDAYSFGSAGCLFKREILEKVGGFRGDLISYEDIELGIRTTIANARLIRTPELAYLHPPFYFYSMQKPISIGQSVIKLRKHYSLLVWLIVFVNALRFLPYGLIPDLRYQQWYKISLGVFLACFKKEELYY